MGRKIPGRKHRGVKLPEQQRAERHEKIKDKINCPPSDIDVQEIPKSCLRIQELIEKSKDKLVKVVKRKKPEHRGVKLPSDNPAFKQLRKESDRAYKRRLYHVVEGVKRETAFENKYNVEVTRNSKTGKAEGLVKRKADPLEAYLKEARQKKPKAVDKTPKLSKHQKRKEKLKKKKPIETNYNEFKDQDSVRFGEIVHAPPTLSMVRKRANSEAERPGRRQLLLKSLLKGEDTKVTMAKPASAKVFAKTIDKKGKRKLLPPLLRMQLEKDQRNIIEQYKSIKKGQSVDVK